MIRFEHTIFALPFAYLGAFLAARGWPGWWTSLWILLAMVGARSAAMAFNRLVDSRFDAQNPRTGDRALPRQLVTPGFVALFVLVASLLFLISAWMLNRLAFQLSPLALCVVLLYSYTKRFTALSHLFLGVALGAAPVGGWIAVRESWATEPFILSAAVVAWVGGFDIIYACQDVDFDRRLGLHSIPARFGTQSALRISELLHAIMVALLIWTFLRLEMGTFAWLGVILVLISLVYEHSLVRPDDLSRVNAAFFLMNGVVSVILLLAVGLDLWLLS
jgi:4-hydroxybenzoate polyprenyltransferase